MCTVKKDINMPEPALTLDEVQSAVPAKPQPPPTSADYDLINRQNSQLLLDMIYSSTKKKPCFFSSKLPCPGTSAAAAAVVDRTLLDEITKIKSTIADIQSQIAKLPQQIVAAFLENQNCLKIRAELDGEDESDPDFDKLSSVSSDVIVMPRHHQQQHHMQCASGRTSMSSDIEVLNYCSHSGRPSCSGASTNTSCRSSVTTTNTSSSTQLPPIDISKEIAHLSARLNAIVLPKVDDYPSTATMSYYEPAVSSDVAKQIATNIFSHWEQRYQTSKSEVERCSSSAPIGNIRCHQAAAAESSAIPNIMPYSSAIDMNVWLK